MKKLMKRSIDFLLLCLIGLLLGILNSISTSFSLDLLYIMLGVSFVFTLLSNTQDKKGPEYMFLLVHLLMFMYLAFALLAIGSSLNKGLVEMIFYVLLLLVNWFGIGYTAFRLKRLMKL